MHQIASIKEHLIEGTLSLVPGMPHEKRVLRNKFLSTDLSCEWFEATKIHLHPGHSLAWWYARTYTM